MFYVIEITSYTDKDKVDKGIYSYETQLEALASFHKKMGGAMGNETFKTELLTVIDERGATLAHDYFVREIEEPEPEEIPEEETPEEEDKDEATEE